MICPICAEEDYFSEECSTCGFSGDVDDLDPDDRGFADEELSGD